MEVKFKFESRAGTFGINVGQFGLFELLANHGMEIIIYGRTSHITEKMRLIEKSCDD